MKSERQYRGFSLTEVLLAVGTFAIGMIFVAGVFPVAIHFTTIATERTIAAVVTDEAFAKIRLYGVDFNSPLWPPDPTIACVDFNDVSGIWPMPIPPDEFAYPSTSTNPAEKHYYWSALCRRVDPNSQLVQVTVFVSRKIGSGTIYVGGQNKPVLWQVSIVGNLGDNVLQIEAGKENWINDGYTIVENMTGEIYRVLERYSDDPATPAVDEERVILLDRNWQGGDSVWVVPPPIGGGRYPCVAIYQKVIGF